MANSIKPVFRDEDVSKPFDAQLGTAIPFTWNGTPPVSNTYRILNTETRAVIHEGEDLSRESICHIPDGGLDGKISNGNNYLFTMRVNYMENGVEKHSSWSDQKIIHCLTKPTVKLTNLPERHGEEAIEITVPTITVGIEYTCGEGSDTDNLNQFKYIVYDANHNSILASQTYTDISKMYTIYGLDNNKIYFIGVYGVSVYGQDVSDEVKIVTHLGNAGNASVLSVVNNKCDGNILVGTDIDTQSYYKEREGIIYYPPGHDFPDDPQHIWDGYFLNTLPNGYVCYTKGFYINGDFSAKVTFGQPLEPDKVFYLKDTSGNEITVRYMLVKSLDNVTVTGAYFLLEVANIVTVENVPIQRIVNNYATGIFPKLTTSDLVDLSVGREKVGYLVGGATKYYYSYQIRAKISRYENGEVVDEAWY